MSSDISPIWREYERASTTIIDAYLRPRLEAMIGGLERGLRERRFSGAITVMKSNGGQMRAEAAKRQPAHTVLSGLSGGVIGGRYFAELVGCSSVVTLDMGGTSTDVSLIIGNEIGYTTDYELDFGIPVSAPCVDLHTIGAGGGSIAWIDQGGMLRVGPHSAGAAPGPVCYGLGGEEVTVTDANLLLGRLDPAYFLGGDMELHPDLARGQAGDAGDAPRHDRGADRPRDHHPRQRAHGERHSGADHRARRGSPRAGAGRLRRRRATTWLRGRRRARHPRCHRAAASRTHVGIRRAGGRRAG